MSAKAAAPAPERGAEVTQESRPEFRLRLVLTTRAARDVLGLLPGTAPPEGAPAPADAEARDRATAALAQLLGLRQAYDVYLRNGGQGEGDEQVVEVRLAGDSEHGANAALLRKLDGKSLLLVGAEKDDRQTGESQFVVFGARAIPAVWSRKDAWSRAARVGFSLGAGGREAGFPMRLLAAIARLPEARAQRESIQRRLADWHRYLGILERTARARQFAVSYTAFRRPPAGILVTFTLQASGEAIPWDKLRSALDEPLEVRERGAAAASGADDADADDWLLGYVAEVIPERTELVVAVDDDVDRLLERRSLELPKAATLVYKASGDLAQIRRLKFGLDLLEQGQAANPNLSSFLFEAAQARRPDPGRRVTLQADSLLQPNLNAGQRAAVEGALNAPDLFLIQGPPGTGKTTVIAEICYQNALRGQRTLIASQSNLAVDHALSRLIHHPRIRALRRGHAGRVEVEGAPFLEDQVVGTWLAQTAKACEADLAARRENVRLFEDLLQNQPRLEALASALQAAEAERPRQRAEIAALEAKATPFKQQLEQMGRALERRRAARASLARLEARFRPGPPARAAEGGDPGAETTEVHRPGESLAERMRWFDHVALHQLQASQAQLSAALQGWEVEPAPPPEPEATPGFEEALAAAQVARQRANELLERLAALRAYLDELGQSAAGWYRGRAQRLALEAEAQSLASRRSALEVRRDLLLAQQSDLRAKLDELAGFDAAQAPVKTALQTWADHLTRDDSGPAADAQLSPPPEFDTPLRRELWAAAGETAQLHRLSAQVLELRTSRAEARRLAELAVGLSAGVERLQGELKPETAQRAAAARPRRATDWRVSPLRALVALDAHGGLHPSSGAEAAWKALEQQLLRQLRRPDWWGSLAGRERQRQADLSQWVQRLRAAAGAFTDRRAELEAFARHRVTRLQERVEATASSLEAAVDQAAKAFGPQAEQRLSQVRAELAAVEQELPGVIARLAAIEQEQAALASTQAQHEARLMAGLEALGTGRPTRHFQYLLRQLEKLPAETWQADWKAACGGFDEAVGRVATLRDGVDPAATLAAIAVDIDEDIQRMAQSLERVRLNRHALERELQIARGHARDLDEQLAGEVEWWRAVHAALPERLRPAGLDAPPESLAYVQAALKASADWAQALEAERAYLARAEQLVRDWARRLRAADERDREDLRQIYIDNANVIGITCVQAGAYHFSREYRNFDCVIVDEVSKATPPELLLPMLKGARVVLVGDHRQLPPMIGPETIAELAAELGVPAAELEHLERSLFQELFESAPPELRVMLTEQYRMHPQIMEAINQFYDDQLVCALPRPDEQRAHGFNLPWLRPDNHLLWLNTPASGAFLEQRTGTSFVNAGELDVVERLLRELDTAWGPMVARGAPPKEVGVITFYAAQARELKQRLVTRAGAYRHLRLRVGTVDRFQGMERPVIIASLVRNNPNGAVGFARKPERVNVAFSRAQELLVIVGSRELFAEQAKDGGADAAPPQNGAATIKTQRPGAHPASPRPGTATAIYSRVAQVVQQAGGLRRTADVPNDRR